MTEAPGGEAACPGDTGEKRIPAPDPQSPGLVPGFDLNLLSNGG